MPSKSLGTLTLDLVAKVGGFEAGLDKASRKTKKTSNQIEKQLNTISKAVAGFSLAAVGGLTTMVASTAESAREIKNLSQVAGATTQEFQRITFAAARYGIEQEKISDILKDTNDRIGDFIQTGGGPMADFFENIAPLVGVTADEFARLSGPDALQLYVDSLEKAGVSQKDMTFYMEAIASDATRLIPLLANNGQQMKILGDEAERTGNVFSDLDFAELETITESTDRIKESFKGISNEIVLAAVPAINDLTDLLGDQTTIDTAQALGNAIVTSINGAVKAVKGAVEITQFLAEELAAMTAGAAADDIVRLEDELETLYSMLDNPTNRVRFFGKDGVVAYYDEDEIWQMIADTENKIVDFRKRMEQDSRKIPLIDPVAPISTDAPEGGRTSGISRTGKEARDAADGLKELEQSLADMRAELDPAMGEFDRYADQIDLIEQFNITAAEKEQLREQAFAQHQERMNQIAGESVIEREEIEKGYWERYLEAARNSLMDFNELSANVIEGFSSRFGNAFESVIFDAETLSDAFKDLGESLLRSVVNSLGQMAAQWTALQAVQMAFGNAATASSVVQAQTTAAAWAPAAAAASLATMGGNAVPAAAALTSTAALSQSLAMVGMAHEGIDSVPQTGTWLLEKGERVTTAETSAKLDRKLDSMGEGGYGVSVSNVFQISAGVAGTVRAEFMKMMPMIEERTKASVMQGISNGGPMAKATGRRR